MMTAMPLTFSSEGLEIDGIIQLPGKRGLKPGVVLCHPHPLYGGNMHNNVNVAVSLALAERGIASLRFDFRGVGASEGSFGEGIGEQNDLRAAFAALASNTEVDRDRIGVMGYSFGGMVALMALRSIDKAKALAAVSPVVTPGLVEGLNLPAYFIVGSQDHVVSAKLLIREAKKIKPSGQVELVPEADHLWAGLEDEVAFKVAAFFKKVL